MLQCTLTDGTSSGSLALAKTTAASIGVNTALRRGALAERAHRSHPNHAVISYRNTYLRRHCLPPGGDAQPSSSFVFQLASRHGAWLRQTPQNDVTGAIATHKKIPGSAGDLKTSCCAGAYSARFLPAPAVAITLALTCAAGVTV